MSQNPFDPDADRSGSEPMSARSPLRLRAVLAIGGALVMVAIVVLCWTVFASDGWSLAVGLVAAVLALAAMVDLVIVSTQLTRARRRP